MVTAEAYKRYLERKDKPTEEGEEKKEQDIHVMLDEIAKMRGYKEKLVGKRKIRPIIQYVDFLLDKNYGFKPIKRGEKYHDRKSKEYKVADKNISPIEQYVDLLGEQKMRGYESEREYDRWIAKKEGFKSLREKEESKAAELGLSSVGEYREFLARERGFESHEQYEKYLDGMYAIRGTYTKLIPQEDFDDVFKLIKDKWDKGHEKFIMFCNELWKDSLEPYFENGKKDAVVFVSDVTTELDKFHKSRSGSMNIYGTDDIAIGLSYCLEGKAVDVILSKDAKTITFRNMEI
jgi:hypothetical protein